MNQPSTLDTLVTRSPRSRSTTQGSLRKPCTVVPLLDNALPLARLRFEGQLRRLDPRQVLVECAQTKTISPGSQLAIGVAGENQTTGYAAVVADEMRPLNNNRVCVVGHFGGALLSLLEQEVIVPSFNGDNLRFEYDRSRRILDRLADASVLTRLVVDRIQVCPNCGGLPIYRSVCKACRSPLIVADELVHHFACAYVASVEQFRNGNQLRCPKCQMGPLIVGSDFEYLPGLHTCLGCSQPMSQLELAARCMSCQHDFLLDESVPHDLIGFQPNRLDLATLSWDERK